MIADRHVRWGNLTEEQKDIALSNGISQNLFNRRMRLYDYTVEEAINTSNNVKGRHPRKVMTDQEVIFVVGQMQMMDIKVPKKLYRRYQMIQQGVE